MTTPTSSDRPTTDPSRAGTPPPQPSPATLWGLPRKLAVALGAAALLLALLVAAPAVTRSSCDKLEALDAKMANASRNEQDDHAGEYSELLAKCLDEQARHL